MAAYWPHVLGSWLITAVVVVVAREKDTAGHRVVPLLVVPLFGCCKRAPAVCWWAEGVDGLAGVRDATDALGVEASRLRVDVVEWQAGMEV